MDKFMSILPKHSKSNGGKRKNLVMSLKPCDGEKTYYRVRLLAFFPSATSGSDRDDPFIERYVHQHWGVNKEKGYPVLEEEVTCLVTPHIAKNYGGNPYDDCPICRLANKYFISFKESGWQDKDACKKNKEFGRKYQAIIPVYVVSNPNWEGDNGKAKVFIINDRKVYQEFRKKVDQASAAAAAQGYSIFNGTNAVDCCIHVKEEPKLVNAGKANEYTFKQRVIDKIVFTNKPYDISAISKQFVDNMGFDEEYYQSSSKAELEAFYKKYCTISNDDIPEDDEPVAVYEEPKKPAASVEIENEAAKPKQMPAPEIDALTADIENLPAEAPAPQPDSLPDQPPADVSVEDMMKELGI